MSKDEIGCGRIPHEVPLMSLNQEKRYSKDKRKSFSQKRRNLNPKSSNLKAKLRTIINLSRTVSKYSS